MMYPQLEPGVRVVGERCRRLADKLEHELGPLLNTLLGDPKVEDVHRNADGYVYVARRGSSLISPGTMSDDAANAAACTVASQRGMVFNSDNPILETTLTTGERFSAIGPPLVESVCLSIRKPSRVTRWLSEYVSDGVVSREQAAVLSAKVAERKNIVVAGATGSGKTTLASALIKEIHVHTPLDRVFIIEDVRELQSPLPNTVQLTTSRQVSALECLRTALRFRPHRIIVGEVRGGEAHAMFKAWNTGHPGSIATIHANSADDAMMRLEELVAEAEESRGRPMMGMIARSIDLIVFISEDHASPAGRKVKEVVEVQSKGKEDYELRTIE